MAVRTGAALLAFVQARGCLYMPLLALGAMAAARQILTLTLPRAIGDGDGDAADGTVVCDGVADRCDLRKRERHAGNDAAARKTGHLRLRLMLALMPGRRCRCQC